MSQNTPAGNGPQGDTVQRRKWRGKKAELELVDLLKSYGWSARRNAGSGVGGSVTDVEALKATTYLAVEVKSSRRDFALIPDRQLAKIRSVLKFVAPAPYQARLGVVAAKFPGMRPPWVFHLLTPEDYERDHVRVRRGQASDWTPTEQEDPRHFSLKPAQGEYVPRMGRPVQKERIPCPRCGKPSVKLPKTIRGATRYKHVEDRTEHWISGGSQS